MDVVTLSLDGVAQIAVRDRLQLVGMRRRHRDHVDQRSEARTEWKTTLSVLQVQTAHQLNVLEDQPLALIVVAALVIDDLLHF